MAAPAAKMKTTMMMGKEGSAHPPRRGACRVAASRALELVLGVCVRGKLSAGLSLFAVSGGAFPRSAQTETAESGSRQE